jgi:uncharacterized protein (TIGR04222 family)
MFALRGPDFLGLFLLLSVAVYLAVHLLIVTREAAQPAEPRIRDPYAIAYLRGDVRELIRVVALSLCLRGLLQIRTTTFQTVREMEIDRVQVPIETVILRLCRTPCQPSALVHVPEFESAVGEYERELTRRGLLAGSEAKGRRWPLVLAGIGFLVLIALIKIKVALSTGHHNILFLILLTGAAVVVLMARAGARRTYAGNSALRNLTSLFASLRSRRAQKSADAVSEAALLAAVFGIYGVAGLDKMAWARMFPQSNSSNNGTSDSSSSCGSGSSGCGGGGGGCGGCGS